MFTVVLRILTMLGSSVSFIKFMNNKDEQKKNSNLGLFAFMGGIIGFIIGATMGLGGMIFMAHSSPR